ncbi:MAG TPA: prepilin-type cleavage/methylation domain-containing protein [Thauera sp.]|nr:prepilin-type cleavage/methylation domain-containing protein [Thauera sp.]HHW63082.1 prepilin-type N-terminal cleavage/methylation domain-containing protein [Rhodocyclaceae bacterium]
MKKHQHGFTLVEIAIVLLIIGLLLGGVLKGQELIDSAKAKNLAQDLRSIPALVHAYQDKFRALPGDDPAAARHLCSGGDACTVAGNGNGVINGDWDAVGGVESVRFWQHVRLANLMTGSTDADDPGFLPRNALGGRIGIQRGNSVLGVPGSLVVCSDAIPGKLVRQLDIALDDGDPARGSLRAGTSGATGLVAISAANPLDDANSHTVCASL